MIGRQKLIEMALQTIKNYLDGDEQTREDDARFALQVIEHYQLKRRNEESLARLVRERPNFTEADARYFMALCRSGRRTPEWLVDKMIGPDSNTDTGVDE